jgi:predicted RND superfamily exporter protein
MAQRAMVSWSGVKNAVNFLGSLQLHRLHAAAMGLGIDFGSYFIARFEEEQTAGKELRQALVRAFVTTGPGSLPPPLPPSSPSGRCS